MKTKKKIKAAAILTIHAPGKMTEKGRKAIAQWLVRNANDLRTIGDGYTEGRFTSRWLY